MNQTQSIATPPNISRHHEQVGGYQTSSVSDGLTKSLESKLNAPASSPEFDLHAETNAVLKDIGLTTADAGGKLSSTDAIRFSQARCVSGQWPRSVWPQEASRSTALWRQATGEGQDISVDVRKALRRFAGFFEGKWETINGRPPSPGGYAVSSVPERFGGFVSSARHATDGTWWRWTFIPSSAHARSIFSAPAKATNPSTTPYSNGTRWS